MTVRDSDRWQTVIALVTLAQLGIGTTFVTLRAQASQARRDAVEQAVRVQQQTSDLAALRDRLAVVETLNVGPRLAVLEDMKARQEKLEFLAYGQILSIGGVLILGLLQVRQQQRRRGSN